MNQMNSCLSNRKLNNRHTYNGIFLRIETILNDLSVFKSTAPGILNTWDACMTGLIKEDFLESN